VSELCTWCGVAVEAGDGFRARLSSATPESVTGERRAVFCRLEHVVPWAIQGAHWDAAPDAEPDSLDQTVEACSQCGAELADARVLLVRHRGEHRVADGFCSVEHLNEWAKAGGRWR
jgi:hypothetical protein